PAARISRSPCDSPRLLARAPPEARRSIRRAMTLCASRPTCQAFKPNDSQGFNIVSLLSLDTLVPVSCSVGAASVGLKGPCPSQQGAGWGLAVRHEPSLPVLCWDRQVGASTEMIQWQKPSHERDRRPIPRLRCWSEPSSEPWAFYCVYSPLGPRREPP